MKSKLPANGECQMDSDIKIKGSEEETKNVLFKLIKLPYKEKNKET